MKASLMFGAMLTVACVTSAAAGERDVKSYGQKAPSAKEVEIFLFPEAECEAPSIRCLARASLERRSIGVDVKFQTGSSELTPIPAPSSKGSESPRARNGKLGAGEIVIEGQHLMRVASTT